MARLKVFNPVARPLEKHVTPAPRPADLDGKRIGLYWNMKGGGNIALHHTERVLKTRYPNAQFVYCQGSVGANMRHVTPAETDRFSTQVDVMVGTTAD